MNLLGIYCFQFLFEFLWLKNDAKKFVGINKKSLTVFSDKEFF